MPHVELSQSNGGVQTLAVHIQTSDYAETLKKRLRETQQTVQMKGFRKGMVPERLVRKMYGKGILAEMVQKIFDETLDDYIKAQGIENMYGRPILAEGHEWPNFDVDHPQDYTYLIDVAPIDTAAPIKGLDRASVFQKPVVQPDADYAEQQIERILSQRSKESIDEKGAVAGEALMYYVSFETVGEDGEADGRFESKAVAMAADKLTATAKPLFEAALIGEPFNCDPYAVEEGADEAFVKKYFLGDAENAPAPGTPFRACVEKVEKAVDFELTPAAIRELMAEANEQIADEAEASPERYNRETLAAYIEQSFSKGFERDILIMLNREIMDALLEWNADFPMPDGFLKRWLLASNEDLDSEILEAGFPDFKKDMLQDVLQGILRTRYEIKVEREDIMSAYAENLQRQYGFALPAEYMEQFLQMDLKRENGEQLLQDLSRTAAFQKTMAAIRNLVTIEEVPMSREDFEAKVRAFNEKYAPADMEAEADEQFLSDDEGDLIVEEVKASEEGGEA